MPNFKPSAEQRAVIEAADNLAREAQQTGKTAPDALVRRYSEESRVVEPAAYSGPAESHAVAVSWVLDAVRKGLRAAEDRLHHIFPKS